VWRVLRAVGLVLLGLAAVGGGWVAALLILTERPWK
jgi:hypothetical protein